MFLNIMKTTAEYIRLLSEHSTELRSQFGIVSMRLFGSVARGEQTENSDVDILVEMPANLRSVCGAQVYLENMLGGSVDLIRNHSHLSSFFRKQVERDGIIIY